MNRPALHNSILLQPVLGFITLCALLSVFALARAAHLIDPAMNQRAFGQIVGLMLMVMGNYLPKLRPLQASRIDRSSGARAERFAGRALLVAGLVSCVVFIGMPLSEAKLAAAWLGTGTFMMLATHWCWLAYSAAALAVSLPTREPASREWRTSVWLLIGYGYICVSAWTMDLLGESPLREVTRTWLVTGFSMLFSVIFPFMVRCPRGSCRSALRAE